MTKILENFTANIKKEKLLSLTNIFVMTVTFVILGIFIHLVVYSQTALRTLEQQAQITIFFKDEAPEASILNTQKQLQTDPRILSVDYVSKEDAYKIFVDINKDEPVLLESLSANILPASLEIKSKNIATLSALATEFNKIDGVEEVKYFKDVIDRFRYWSTIVYIVGIILLVILFVVSYSVIISTLRATINSKGVELEILKLVGASDYYVKSPLIYQGVFYGAFSALIAGLLMILISIFTGIFGFFGNGLEFAFLNLHIGNVAFSVIVAFILVLSGGLLGFLGSQTAVKKYLKY